MAKVADYLQMFSNMGWRYVSYRAVYELKRRSGILKRNFPVNPEKVRFITLKDWKNSSRPFLFNSRDEISFTKNPSVKLKEEFDNIISGKIRFFNYEYFDLTDSYDWITNPQTGFRYDINRHWVEIDDFNREAGDIKYVWEKSRFSFLYTLIRYDYHFNEDHSDLVFSQIEDWMNANPINMGPNYKCSQEISIRILNWIFALYFYKNSLSLTDEFFERIQHYIYWQLHHVYQNIDFSRIAVRNNHAITETLALYIVPTLFPQFPNSEKWKKAGKKWFEQEIAYQVYDDGTYLQFSMNYHRVVVQLLTLALRIAELNGDTFKKDVYVKAYKSVDFLYQCQEESNGWLPNYGSNDGALFFKLSGNDYRDYRPQLDALHRILTGQALYPDYYEDASWYGYIEEGHGFKPLSKKQGVSKYVVGGYYLIREADCLTFIRCGSHKDRPAHADNLHLDIWYKGKNILPDGGTYKYNTDRDMIGYFMGTASHNTVMLDNFDQMRKGARFIWYDWSQCVLADVRETETHYEFTGVVSCFRYLSKEITHKRVVRKKKGVPEWDVTDIINHKPVGLSMHQIWHSAEDGIIFNSDTEPALDQGWYSSYYGQKEKVNQYTFSTDKDSIETKISLP